MIQRITHAYRLHLCYMHKTERFEFRTRGMQKIRTTALNGRGTESGEEGTMEQVRDFCRRQGAVMTLVLVSLIWGGGFVTVENLLKNGWASEEIVLARFSLAALTMGLGLAHKLRKSTKYDVICGLISGSFLFLAFYCQTYGQGMTTLSNTAFFSALNIIILPFLAVPLFHTRLDRRILLIACLALVGVAIMSYGDHPFSLNTGDIFVLLCAFFFAAQIIGIEACLKYSDPARLSFFQLLTTAFWALLFCLIKNGAPFHRSSFPQGLELFSLLYTGLLSTCLCYFLQSKAQAKIPASAAGILLSLEGVFATIFSFVLVYEPFRWRSVIGSLFILAAVIAVNLFGSRTEVEVLKDEEEERGQREDATSRKPTC